MAKQNRLNVGNIAKKKESSFTDQMDNDARGDGNHIDGKRQYRRVERDRCTTCSFSLPAHEKEWIYEFARLNGMSTSEAVRAGIALLKKAKRTYVMPPKN
jgi:hypothetical protein